MAITYDAIGNPLTYRGYTLTWQNGRQLASMRFGTVNIGFTYDVDGLRTSKTVHNVDLEHKYYYVGNRLQYETIGDSSALWYFYDADGNPSGIRYKDHNGTVNDYYFVCNWRGDVIQIYNAAGELVSTYDYDAWGKVSENSTDKDTQNIADINPIRYRGYYYDSETGLYYVNSRYYDPAVKRFLNSDDDLLSAITPQGFTDKNYFAYCDNNPVVRADNNGDLWNVIIGAAVGGVLGATTQAIDQGGVHNKKELVKVVISGVSGAIGGGLGACGLPLVWSVVSDTSISFVTSLGLELVDNDYKLEDIDWLKIGADTAESALTSFAVGYFYDDITESAMDQADRIIKKGKNKIIKGITSKKGASKVKGTIKTGKRFIRAGIKRKNTIRGLGSVFGSVVSATRSIWRKLIGK